MAVSTKALKARRSHADEKADLEGAGALLSPSVKTVLIRGLPGTGKTTLAFELFKIAGGGMYVSTRVSQARLSEQYPHVKSMIDRGKLVGIQVGPAKVRFEDARLGTSTDIVEIVLKGAHKLRCPLIVLDSWDALAKELDEKERLKAEKALVAMVETSDAKVVFVGEDINHDTTSYLVDAVVDLYDAEHEGRRIRKMQWGKIRGTEIPDKFKLFTLAGGRFTMLEKGQTNLPEGFAAKSFNPLPHSPTHYSTGSEDLDTLLEGGLKRGTLTLIGIGNTVPSGFILPLTTMIRCNFLTQGGCCVSIPAGRVSPEKIGESTLHYVSRETVESSLRIGHYGKLPQNQCYFKLDAASLERAGQALWRMVDEVKGASSRPCLIQIGLDAMEYVYQQDELTKYMVTTVLQKVQDPGDAMILTLRTAIDPMPQLATFSENFLKIDEVASSSLIHSVKPASTPIT